MKIIKRNKKIEKTENTEKSPLDFARERKQEMLDQGIVFKHKTPIESLALNPTSLRKAINAMCYDCNGGELYHQRTRYCTIFTCPLWAVRPYSKKITKQQCLDHKED